MIIVTSSIIIIKDSVSNPSIQVRMGIFSSQTAIPLPLTPLMYIHIQI
jgi:hypothetical protein